MCDYCDCRVVPVIAELGADHDALTTMAADVRRAVARGDLPAARARLTDLSALLTAHTAVEEEALFPALAATAGAVAASVGELLADHADIDAALVAAGAAGDDAWVGVVDGALTRLAEHIHREEYDVFPAAAQVVEPGQWDAVRTSANQARARRRAAA